MFIVSTMQWHYAKQFTKIFVWTLLGLFVIVSLIDMIELLRRTGGRNYIGFNDIAVLLAYKLWNMMNEILPFAVLLGALVFFWRKIKHNELTALRAAGATPLQILIAPLVATFLIGLVQLLIISHIAANFTVKYDNFERSLFDENRNQLSLGQTGIWLRQGGENTHKAIISAKKAEFSGKKLSDVTVFLLDENSQFLRRVEANTALLRNGYWLLREARILDGEGGEHKQNTFLLETSLTEEKIENSFSNPEAISFWELPTFIESLRQSGFNAVQYRLQFHKLLSQPFFLMAITLIASVIVFRANRRGQNSHIILLGLAAGFVLYFSNRLIQALGLTGGLPAELAAWIPTVAACSIGLAFLLHLEEA